MDGLVIVGVLAAFVVLVGLIIKFKGHNKQEKNNQK